MVVGFPIFVVKHFEFAAFSAQDALEAPMAAPIFNKNIQFRNRFKVILHFSLQNLCFLYSTRGAHTRSFWICVCAKVQ